MFIINSVLILALCCCVRVSRWKKIDITEVNSSRGIMGYVNKETSLTHTAFDFANSIPIIPNK